MTPTALTMAAVDAAAGRAAADPGLPYTIAAYVVIFVALFGYLALLHLHQARLRRRLGELDRRLLALSPPGSAAVAEADRTGAAGGR